MADKAEKGSVKSPMSPTPGGAGDPATDNKQSSGMSQANKDDLGVGIAIILITVLAIIVTVIKIILFDIKAYPEIFGGGPTASPPTNITTTTSSN